MRPHRGTTVSQESRPYTLITADTHGGASIEMYRDYLDPGYRDEFDAWRGGYKNPSRSHIGGKKQKNWDSALRLSDLESDGVVAAVCISLTS